MATMRGLRWFQFGAAALCVAGLVLVSGGTAQAQNIQDIQQEVVNGVVRTVLQNVRDQIQRRRGRNSTEPLRFSGSEASILDYNDPFASIASTGPMGALAYSKVPTKAPTLETIAPSYLFGVNVIGTGDASLAGGVTTSSAAVAGAFDVTRVGVFTATDALTVIGTATGVWSSLPGIDASATAGSATIAYANGGFSTDFTVTGTWSSVSLKALGIVLPADSTAVSYAPNVQYKFDLGNSWYIEPTVGVTYTESYTRNFETKIGDSTEVHGGARFGTEWLWGAWKVQPSVTSILFTVVDQNSVFDQFNQLAPNNSSSNKGLLGGRGSGKLNFVWDTNFSSYIEAHGSSIGGTKAYGGSGGLRWTF